MRYSIALLILISLAISSNCLRRTYDIQVSLVGSTLRQPIPISPKPSLVIDGVQTFGRLDIRLNNQHARLFEITPQNCLNCLILLEFIPNDGSKTLYTSIKADLVSDKNFEDFLELAISENNDILGIKYGLNKRLKEGENANPTVIKEVVMGQQLDSSLGGSLGSFSTQQSTTDFGTEGAAPKPQEEQSFFKKYMWWFIIGGFIVFQFLTFDKDKLMEAANQQAQRGAQGANRG